MRFSEDAERFMRPDGDRLVSLAGLLAARSLPYSVVRIGEARHVLVRLGSAKPQLALVAHYDRIAGSPGALDNSCACLQLAEFAARRTAGGAAGGAAGRGSPTRPSFLIAFTDAEEAPGSGEASTQGAFELAKKLRSAAGAEQALAALVFDVTGRGGRLLLSSAPAELLARTGLGQTPVAEGHRALVGLAKRAASRARIKAPLEAALPWSDDLGLTLGGLPALALSLLPDDQAALLASGARPPLWDILHTSADAPELAEEGAFALVSAFLDALGGELTLGIELARPEEGSLY
jgi:hypothetical protein